MTLHFEKPHDLTTIIVSIFAGFFVYAVLSYLYVAPRVTIPISVVMSTLIFGLTKYYSTSNIDSKDIQNRDSTSTNNNQNGFRSRYQKIENGNLSTIFFVTIFVIAILISSLTYRQDFHIFINWNEIGAFGMIQLGAAIMLCFFIPGFAIVLAISKKYKMNPILEVLLAYLFSMLITGLTAYVSALSFDRSISESKNLFIAVYLSILVGFLISYSRYGISSPINLQIRYYYYHFKDTFIIKSWQYLKMRTSELLVFGSLFVLLIVYTYYLYGGITIGDQWYHQGRALLFMSGSFRDAALWDAESFYPPFQSALLAALTTLSGVPLVNSYASIAFLNAVPMFAFYYFFLRWVPTTMRRAALLACSLFTISSGFGWIYLLQTVSTNPILSPQSILDTLQKIQVLDIVRTSNFVIPTAPDFSTGLIYMSLPAGFVLLGTLASTITHSRFTNIAIVTAISVLGIMSHYEFYIFIIISSLLPLIFTMKAKDHVYVGFLFAFLIVYLTDIAVPGKFFTSNEILGFPLLFLTVLFVVITWAIYLTGRNLYKFLKAKLVFLNRLRNLPYHDVKFKFLIGVIITSVVAYVYLLSFIILSQLSIDTIIEQTRESIIPWYLYPMRLGIVGLVGLAFVLSYIFKRFEKQVFVFGIMIVISFILGPYYDENRFSKYAMVGMVGFASLMVYKILNWGINKRTLCKIAVVSIIIVPSGLSILIFIGYTSLILQTQDFVDTLSRRHFPSMSELRLFEVLHDKVDVESKKYNVISFLKEYDGKKDGIMGKIQGFSGLPNDKLRAGSSTLNASTLDALYHLLSYNDARYIIIPKDSIKVGNVLTEPTRFVLEYFKRIYEDNNYILLDVPPLVPPTSSSNTDVALIYNQMDDLLAQKISDTQLLKYDSKTFDIKRNETSVTIQKDPLTEGLNLLGSKMDKGITIWSKTIPPEKRVNYIEARFQITSQNENKSNDIRLEWKGADKQSYYVKFSKDGLELYQKLIKNQDKKILSKNTEAEKKQWIWYTLKVESLDNSINVYINNVLQIQTSRAMNNNTEGISRVGLTSHYNNVQFKPLKIGTVSDYPQEIHDKSKYYDYYYPLSLLAISKYKYNIFSNSDLSTFSKDVIFTPDTLKLDNATYNRYLDYVNTGGKLIVINSNNNFNQTFSQLFSIRSVDSKPEAFTNIAGNKNDNASINVPGLVKKVEVERFPDVNVIASYRDSNNQSIAPFAIERIFSSGGRIVLLNAEGYFNTISNSPNQYFFSLSNISMLVGLDSGKWTNQNLTASLDAFLGKMEISGKVTLNSSSLSPIDEDWSTYSINTSRITIHNKANKNPINFDDVSIKSLKLIGDYEVTINLKGLLELPDMMSDHDYINMQIPTDFNLTVELSPKRLSQMDIVIQNHSSIKSIEVNNGSKIEFYKIKVESPVKSLPVLLKSPNMKANGNISIEIGFPGSYVGPVHLQGDPQGTLRAKFGFVDNYNQPYRNATKTSFVTYLQSLVPDDSFDIDEEHLKLPGDIYFKAKERGQDIPFKKVLGSSSSIITLIALISITIIVSKLIWRKKNL